MSNTRSGGKQSALTSFMKQNKSLVFMLPVLAVLVIVLVIIYWPKTSSPSIEPSSAPTASASSEASVSTPSDMNGAAVVVLPQVERLQSGETLNMEDPVKDVFSTGTDAFMLKGLLMSSQGNHYAIIETGQKAIIVGEGDFLTEKWKVSSIQEQEVVLASDDGSEMILESSK